MGDQLEQPLPLTATANEVSFESLATLILNYKVIRFFRLLIKISEIASPNEL